MSCHCGKGASYEECCLPYIEGKDLPATAEALMRSRYSAYASGEIEYIATTHIPKTRGDVDLEAAKQWSESAEWVGLEIVSTEAGGARDEAGRVEFAATYSVEGAEYRHHENSEFQKEDGRWFYVDGDIVKKKPVVRDAPKVGRNDPCPCGSGKKFKRCCG